MNGSLMAFATTNPPRVLRAERNIDALGATGFFEKHNVVLNVAGIEELPYGEFGDVQSEIDSGRTIIRIAPFGRGISQSTLTLFASPFQKFLTSALSALTFLVPLSGIALAIFLENWWWLALVAIPFITISIGKRIYLRALFNTVGSSEKAFCFAFCGNWITVETPDGKIRSRGQAPL